MPIAVASQVPQHFDLKSIEGGFVEIRRMSQGEKMHRSGLMSGMKFRSQGRSKDFEGELTLANQRVTEYEFATCIVDHNLEKNAPTSINGFGEDNDPGVVKLDFKNPADLAMLDGRVGDEIGQLLNRVNLFDEEGDEELEN